jgi:hypothetical protein
MFDLSPEERSLLALIFLQELLPAAIREQIGSMEEHGGGAERRDQVAKPERQ